MCVCLGGGRLAQGLSLQETYTDRPGCSITKINKNKRQQGHVGRSRAGDEVQTWRVAGGAGWLSAWRRGAGLAVTVTADGWRSMLRSIC